MMAARIFARLCAIAVISFAASAVVRGEQLDRAIPSLGEIDAVKRIVLERTTLAPFSYVMFCQTHPGDCRGGVETTVPWNIVVRMRVASINRRVNRMIRPRIEAVDVWSAGTSAGDCEDFALTKRRALIRAGFPPSSLQMAVARTRHGNGHAVLMLRTSDGDLVLDNRNDQLREWYQTDLAWLKIASAENPRIWYAMN